MPSTFGRCCSLRSKKLLRKGADLTALSPKQRKTVRKCRSIQRRANGSVKSKKQPTKSSAKAKSTEKPKPSVKKPKQSVKKPKQSVKKPKRSAKQLDGVVAALVQRADEMPAVHTVGPVVERPVDNVYQADQKSSTRRSTASPVYKLPNWKGLKSTLGRFFGMSGDLLNRNVSDHETFVPESTIRSTGSRYSFKPQAPQPKQLL